MKVFDEYGNYQGDISDAFNEEGEYIGRVFSDAKDKVEEAFEGSWLWGIIFLFVIAPGWALLGVVFVTICTLTFGRH